MQPNHTTYKIIFDVFNPSTEATKLINEEFQEGEEQVLRQLIKEQFKDDRFWEYEERVEIALFLRAHQEYPRISLRSEEYEEKHTHEIVFFFDGDRDEFEDCRAAIVLAAKGISQAIFNFTKEKLNYVSAPSWKIVIEEDYYHNALKKAKKVRVVSPKVRAKMKLPVLWEKLFVRVCEDESNFFAILDELFTEFCESLEESERGEGFYCNRNVLLEAYREKRMHLLFVHETDEIYKQKSRKDPLFCRGLFGNCSLYLLPAFLVTCGKGNKCVELLWVGARARRMGLATCLVETLKVKYTSHVLPASLPFWESTKVEIIK